MKELSREQKLEVLDDMLIRLKKHKLNNSPKLCLLFMDYCELFFNIDFKGSYDEYIQEIIELFPELGLGIDEAVQKRATCNFLGWSNNNHGRLLRVQFVKKLINDLR